MASSPTFTVVIPNHARVAPALAAVRSALRHAPHGVDVVVVDDASPNAAEIEAVLQSLGDHRVQFVALTEKGTASRARNAGVAAARGDWIAFLDSDDVFEPGKWTALTQAIAAHPDADVFHDQASVVIDDRLVDTVPHRGLRDGEAVGDFLFVHGELLSTCTLTVRRDLLRRVPWRAGLPRHQDFQFVLDLEAAGARFVHVPAPGATIHWSTMTRPADKGESATYSLGWLETVRARLSDAAFMRAAFRFGIVKQLEHGRRIDALRTIARHRCVPDARAAAIAMLLFLAPQPMRRGGYRVYKRLIQPHVARRAASAPPASVAPVTA